MDFIDFKTKYEHKKVVKNNNSAPLKPKVSVCVQTYQHVNYIKECLNGILMQKTNFEFEILLGEDDSSDGTREICIDYAKSYPDKIRLFIHHRENNIKIGGQPTGRFNFLYNLYSSQGKYIALCEGDDYWTDPLKLQKQVDFLEKNKDFVVASHNINLYYQNFQTFEPHRHNVDVDKIITENKLKKGYYLQTLSLVFRNIHIKFPLNKKFANGDSYLLSYLGKYGKGVILHSIKPGVYRIHKGGVWSIKKTDTVFAVQNRIKLYEMLKVLHENEEDIILHYDKKITSQYRVLLSKLELLSLSKLYEVNLEYIKRHNFFKDKYRLRILFNQNFKYLKNKF